MQTLGDGEVVDEQDGDGGEALALEDASIVVTAAGGPDDDSGEVDKFLRKFGEVAGTERMIAANEASKKKREPLPRGGGGGGR